MPTIEEKILAKRAKHPDWPAWKISKALDAAKGGAPVSVVNAVLAGAPVPATQVAPAEPTGGMIDVKSLVKKYDTRSAILKAISDLPRGKVLSEAELCRAVVGTDKYRFNRTVENCNTEFSAMRLKVKLDRDRDAVFVWGKPQDIEELKKAVNPWA